MHGVGYSRFNQRIEEIESELTVFVSANDPVEIVQLKLTNQSNEVWELYVTSYAEWLLGFAPDEHREFHKLFIETSADGSPRRFTRWNVCGALPMTRGGITMWIGLTRHLWRSASR